MYCSNSFCGVCYVLLHAPPSLCPHVTSCLPRVLRTFSSCALSVLPSFALPVCLPSSVVVPVSVLPASPAPAVSLLYVLWSSLHPGALVPPSGYLVAAVTALLPCFHAGSVVKLCYPSVIRFMATKATCPVWGFHPLHHVTGDVGELSLAILRYSSSDDPGPY